MKNCSTEHQCPRICRYSRLLSHHKDWKKYDRAPHPPTRRATPRCGVLPAWQVGGSRWACAPHPPTARDISSSLCDARGPVNNGMFLDTGVLSSRGPSDLTLFSQGLMWITSLQGQAVHEVNFHLIWMPLISESYQLRIQFDNTFCPEK